MLMYHAQSARPGRNTDAFAVQKCGGPKINTFKNGCPKGNAGLAWVLSTRLASSSTVGSRQPDRPPMTASLHAPWAPSQPVSKFGVRCQTRPVSRSKTAALLKFERTMNLELAASVWSQDGVA